MINQIKSVYLQAGTIINPTQKQNYFIFVVGGYINISSEFTVFIKCL